MLPSDFPPRGRDIVLTDGGLETTLIFREGTPLDCFAAFPLLASEGGRDQLRRYFRPYLETAVAAELPFLLSAPTWRASADWGARLGYGASELGQANRKGVALLQDIKAAWARPTTPIIIEGVIGPRGDGYSATARMSCEAAQVYHSAQVAAFAEAGADLVSAVTLTYPDEAIGVVRAARAAGLPVAVSFTVETDGRLPSGDTLRDAVERVDRETGSGAAYFMVNCAHPSHFEDALPEGQAWVERVRGLRANASTMSHAELDQMEELDAGDPVDLGRRYRDLRRRLPGLSILGGCCGCDHRHVAAICESCSLDGAA